MTDIIYGRHPVVAAPAPAWQPPGEVIVAQGAGGHWLPEVKRLARAAGVRLRIRPTHEDVSPRTLVRNQNPPRLHQHHPAGREASPQRAASRRASASSTPCTSPPASSSTTTSRGLHARLSSAGSKSSPRTTRSTSYRHNRTGEDNADAHLKRQIMGREVVVAITAGKLDFGPWEQIFYGEFDGRRRSACWSRSSANRGYFWPAGRPSLPGPRSAAGPP